MLMSPPLYPHVQAGQCQSKVLSPETYLACCLSFLSLALVCLLALSPTRVYLLGLDRRERKTSWLGVGLLVRY